MLAHETENTEKQEETQNQQEESSKKPEETSEPKLIDGYFKTYQEFLVNLP
jgi:hypothetical protein